MMLNTLSTTHPSMPLPRLLPPRDILVEISNQNLENLKKGQLETRASTKDFLVFKFSINPNLTLAFETLAYKTYLLFQKYAPALDLELKAAVTPSSSKIKNYTEFVGYDSIHQLFFIEKSCCINVRFNVNSLAIINFNKNELDELLKTVDWKFKELRNKQSFYFQNEWKFDEVTSSLRPLRTPTKFKKYISLGKIVKEEGLFLTSQLVLEAFVNLNNSNSKKIFCILGDFKTTNNVIVGSKIFDEYVVNKKRKNPDVLSENIESSNSNTASLTSNFVLNHFTPSNQNYLANFNYLSEQHPLSTSAYSNFLRRHSFYSALVLETGSLESITPQSNLTPSTPFCNDSFATPLITLSNSSANDFNSFEINEQEQQSFIHDLFPPLTSFLSLTNQTNF